MKVIFHSDGFGRERRTGLGRYAQELSSALRDLDPSLQLIPFSLSHRGHRRVSRERLTHSDQFESVRPRIDGRLLMVSWATVSFPRIESWIGDTNLVHTLELGYPVATKKPWVVTVHDLGPLTHPQYFSKARPWLFRHSLQAAIRNAEIIVSVSETTAEAIEYFANGSLQGRLQILPEGVSEKFFERAEKGCLSGVKNLPPNDQPFLLCAGSFNPRKNLKRVIDAFERIADKIPLHLVLAGEPGWDYENVYRAINTSKFRSRIHRPGFVTDDQLRALYQNAEGFVYVSLMEGFGLPILEAMAAGCPVITSNTSSMPEIANGAALLVNPSRDDEIADAMYEVVSSDELRCELVEKGRVTARQYSWDKCARSMLDIYKGMRL